MSNKSLKELKELLNKEQDYLLNQLKVFQGDKNPQILEMYNTIKGKIDMIDTILEYTKTGSKIYFDHI